MTAGAARGPDHQYFHGNHRGRSPGNAAPGFRLGVDPNPNPWLLWPHPTLGSSAGAPRDFVEASSSHGKAPLRLTNVRAWVLPPSGTVRCDGTEPRAKGFASYVRDR